MLPEVKEYKNRKLVDLKLMCEEKNITYKDSKEDIIKSLDLHDLGKYVFPTTQEKDGKKFIIGISLNNTNHLNQISRLIEKGEAESLFRYSNDRVYYLSNQKIL